LYNKAKKSNLDYILFLIKRVPRYKSELKSLDLLNKLQLENEDFLITNKIIKREVLVKAINYFYNDIIKYKWIYHDDNIWNILTRMYGQTSKIVKKYIYIYKRNNDSANIKKNNFFEVKNRIYRLMSLIKIIKNSQVNDSYLYYDNYYKSYINIYKAYDNSILRPSEIKNNLINISFSFLDIYKNNKATIDEINVIMNSISQNKIIIFYNSLENNIIDYLTYVSIKKYLQENTLRKIISININDNTQLNNTFKYIYSNDILIGLGNLIFHYNFIQLINNFNKNKIILLYNNFINNSNKYNISSNLFIYSFKRNYNKKITNNFLYIPNNIINLANYFNNIRYFENINNNLTVFFNNYTIEDIGRINYITNQNFAENQTIFNLTKILNNTMKLTEIIKIIQESKIIITDNFMILQLSVLSFTSCILYGNDTDDSNINILFDVNLNYIKYMSNINELENQLIYFQNESNKLNEYNIQKDYTYLKLELNI
jgi:hypothetical protein